MHIRRNIVTITAASAGVLALAGGCAWPVAPRVTSHSTPSAGVVACAASALTPEVRDGQGTVGTQRFTVVLTNHGSAACAMVGYPVLVLRDADGRLLPPAHPVGESKTIRIASGRSATATMTVTPAACPTVPMAATAAVSPPDNGSTTTLPVRIPVCRPTISPVVG